MKDRVFSGASVEEALAAAAAALGVRRVALRHVVLDPGTPGGRGISPTQARVAVLLESRPPGPAEAPLAPGTEGPRPVSGDRAPDTDPRAAIRHSLRLLAEAAGTDLSVDSEERDDAFVVHLSGPGSDLLLEDDGEVYRAVEHVLQRSWRGRDPRRLSLECAGYRAGRDAALGDRARALAAAVRADGRPRTTEPLNAYERRIVHVAVGEDADLETFSVGPEGDRRVTIAPRGTRGERDVRGPDQGSPGGGPDRT